MTSISTEFSLPQRYKTNLSSPAAWITSHLLRNWWLAGLLLIGAAANAGLASAVPVYIGEAFNLIRTSGWVGPAILRIALLIVFTQILRGLLQFVRNFSAEMIGQRLERDIREELYTSLLGKSMTFHSLQAVGDTMARATNDVREINFMISPGFNMVVGSALFLVMPVALAPRYHPSLVLVPVLFIIAYFVALYFYLHELQPITTGVRQAFGTLNTRLAEAIDGIETVKSMSQERSEVEWFGENARRFRDAVIHQGDTEARFIPMLLLGFALAGGLLHAILLFRNGLLDIGQVVAYFGLLQLFDFPTFSSNFAYSQVSLGMVAARRILDLINRQNNLDQNSQGHSSTMRGEVVFNRVTFAYNTPGQPDHEPVLQDISFKVKPGQTVAIVGQTGSGKTSLVKLINRTYDVSSGQVLVDGVDVRDWNMENLRRQISIIEQDIFLFSRTIGENIAFGDPQAGPVEIEKSAQAAQADDFIQSFKDGYQTVVGERGVTLSGGQRQRLALARAFLTDPRILILDDSTSAIDSATEDKIQRAINTAAQGRTTFIITHRLSQIRWADLILVLRQGRLAAVGTHEELMKSSESYRRIFSE